MCACVCVCWEESSLRHALGIYQDGTVQPQTKRCFDLSRGSLVPSFGNIGMVILPRCASVHSASWGGCQIPGDMTGRELLGISILSDWMPRFSLWHSLHPHCLSPSQEPLWVSLSASWTRGASLCPTCYNNQLKVPKKYAFLVQPSMCERAAQWRTPWVGQHGGCLCQSPRDPSGTRHPSPMVTMYLSTRDMLLFIPRSFHFLFSSQGFPVSPSKCMAGT